MLHEAHFTAEKGRFAEKVLVIPGALWYDSPRSPCGSLGTPDSISDSLETGRLSCIRRERD
jgi:hypothetical protein